VSGYAKMPPASHQVSVTSLKLLIQQIHPHVNVERDSGMCVMCVFQYILLFKKYETFSIFFIFFFFKFFKTLRKENNPISFLQKS
jgi:hypothetical protein